MDEEILDGEVPLRDAPPQAEPAGDAGSGGNKPETRKKRIFLLALLLIFAMTGGWWLLFHVNRFSLEIRLRGDGEMLVEYGSVYQEPGADVLLRGTLFWKEGIPAEDAALAIREDIREDTLGRYEVTYSAQYHHWNAEAVRRIRVVDTVCPVITLKRTGKTILPGQKYEEEGYSAADNRDGDLTDKVHRTEEYGKIIYTVMDSSGNPASVEREIPYYDPLPPQILLEGGEEVTIPCGTIYTDPGFTATDNADGEITDRVTVEGEVIWYQPGTYAVSYSVSDAYGNQTSVTRQIQVEAQPRPEIVYPNGRVIYLTFDDGPVAQTSGLLDLLKRYGVKATFFVTDTGYSGTMWRIVNEGHSIGIHTMTHDYNTIYASPENYFRDLLGMQEIIYQNTGVKTTLLRFPGGSSNVVSNYNPGIMTTLTEAVENAGFQYFDWNVDSNDAGGALRAETVAANVIGGVQNQRISVVLQHDTRAFSVKAVEDIIIWGLKNGYKFLPLTQTSPNVHHCVLN